MSLACAFGLGLTLGALASPLAQLATAHLCGTHWLDVTTKEQT
jgi:hypothetical protein